MSYLHGPKPETNFGNEGIKGKSIDQLINSEYFGRNDYPPFVWKDNINFKSKWGVAQMFGIADETIVDQEVHGKTRYWLPEKKKYTISTNEDIPNHETVDGLVRYYFFNNTDSPISDEQLYRWRANFKTKTGKTARKNEKGTFILNGDIFKTKPKDIKTSESYAEKLRIEELENTNDNLTGKLQQFDSQNEELKVLLTEIPDYFDALFLSQLAEYTYVKANIRDLILHTYSSFSFDPKTLGDHFQDVLKQFILTGLDNTRLITNTKNLSKKMSSMINYTGTTFKQAGPKVYRIKKSTPLYLLPLKLIPNGYRTAIDLAMGLLIGSFFEDDESTKVYRKGKELLDAVQSGTESIDISLRQNVTALNAETKADLKTYFNKTDLSANDLKLLRAEFKLKTKQLKETVVKFDSLVKAKDRELIRLPLEKWILENAGTYYYESKYNSFGEETNYQEQWSESINLVNQQRGRKDKKSFSTDAGRLTNHPYLPFWQLRQQCHQYGLKVPKEVLQKTKSTEPTVLTDTKHLPDIPSHFDFRASDIVDVDRFAKMFKNNGHKLFEDPTQYPHFGPSEQSIKEVVKNAKKNNRVVFRIEVKDRYTHEILSWSHHKMQYVNYFYYHLFTTEKIDPKNETNYAGYSKTY